MHSVLRASLLVAVVSLASAGCKKAEPMSEPSPLPTPSAEAPTAQAPTAPAPSAGLTGGKVLETMDSGGYTYARLASGGAEVWVAGPQTPIAVGQEVGVTGGSLMTGFRSDTLERTFDQIYFVSGFSAAGAAVAAPAGAAPPAASPHGAPAAAPAGKVAAIEPAAGGKRVADLFARKDALAGKSVTVRGKVVKFNAGIMGRNWIHLQDGSGAAGTNDLTITTDAVVAVGDVVTVKGVVGTDRDFGAGYNYALIVENATVELK
jgi:hypothetical protein